jgi:hypothetical protein
VLAGARRTLLALGAVAAVTAVLAALGALAAGGSVVGAVSTGFYLVGAFLMVAGFFSGNRGPLRSRGDERDDVPSAMLFGVGMAGRFRSATNNERRDAIATAGLFLLAGVVLVALGVALDERIALV